MKRIFLTILLVAASWTLQAQWSYTRTATYIGYTGSLLGQDMSEITCGIDKAVVNQAMTPVSTSFPSREECEADRVRSESSWNSRLRCYRVVCSSCFGTSSTADATKPGDISILGAERGEPFIATSPEQIIPEWMTETEQKRGSLFGYENNFPRTGDNAFDKAYDKMYSSEINKSIKYLPVKQDENKISIIENQSEHSNEYNNQYESKGGYQTMIELGKKNGLDFSDYISQERWDKMNTNEVKDMTSEEIFQWNADYNRFVSDLYGSDPMFDAFKNFQSEVKTELTDLGIKVVTTLATAGATMGAGLVLSPYTMMWVKPLIEGGAGAISAVAQAVNHNDYSNIIKNTVGGFAEGAIGSTIADVKGGAVLYPLFVTTITAYQGGNMKEVSSSGIKAVIVTNAPGGLLWDVFTIGVNVK
jgi:hypothetical protein